MDEAVRHFDDLAAQWRSNYDKPAFRDRLHLFVSELQRVTPQNGKVLDYGCGPGLIAMACAKSGYDVTAVDAAAKMVQVAEQERQRQLIVNARVELIRPEIASLKKEAFDAVVCSSVIEYVPNDDHFMGTLASYLRPGGHLLISIPHATSLVGQVEDIATRLRLRSSASRSTADVSFAKRRYDHQCFARMLVAHGLQPRRLIYYELPNLGRVGIQLSRLRCLGVMVLVIAEKVITEKVNA